MVEDPNLLSTHTNNSAIGSFDNVKDPFFSSHVLFTIEAGFTKNDLLIFHNRHTLHEKKKTHIVQFRHQHQFSLNVWDGIVWTCFAGQYILLQTQRCYLLTFLEHNSPITRCYPVGYSTKHGSCTILPQPMPVIAPEITMRLPTLGDRKIWTSNLAKLFIRPETSSFFLWGCLEHMVYT